MYGSFNEDAQQVWDFTRCQRPNGTFYGTRGKCKSGDEVGAREVPEAKPREALAKAAPKAKAKAAPKKAAPKAKAKLPARAKKALDAATPEQLAKLSQNPRVTREQKAIIDSAIKEKKAKSVEPPKPEEKGYKPKEREERKGLRGLKDRLLGARRDKSLDTLVPDEKEIKKARDDYKQIIGERLARSSNPEERERLWKSLGRADKNADLEIARSGTNKQFVQDLKANLPPNVKATFDKEDGYITLSQKVGKNTIETTFDQREGFNYRVNGRYDTGTVKDRKEQLRVAMAVRSQYDALVRSLPEGTVIKTSPYDGDGGGAARQKAYERIGFGKPNDIQEMFAMKKDGRMVPSTIEQQREAFENPDTLWFAEEEEIGDNEQTKIWLQIITGQDVLKGK